MSTDRPSAAIPRPPAHIREAARRAPGHWFGMVDPEWEPPPGAEADGAGPPPWAVIGQWRSDEHGEVDAWEDNPAYRPSPGMLGWAEPADEVDAAVQRAATGYGPVEDVALAAVTAEFAVHLTPDDAPVLATAPDGTPVVPVYTAPDRLRRAGTLRHRVVTADELFSFVPAGHALLLNPAGPVSLRLAPEDVEDARMRILDGETPVRRVARPAPWPRPAPDAG